MFFSCNTSVSASICRSACLLALLVQLSCQLSRSPFSMPFCDKKNIPSRSYDAIAVAACLPCHSLQEMEHTVPAFGTLVEQSRSSTTESGACVVSSFSREPHRGFSEPCHVICATDQIGSTAVVLLKERIENPDKPCSKVTIGGDLIVRQSVRQRQRRAGTPTPCAVRSRGIARSPRAYDFLGRTPRRRP